MYLAISTRPGISYSISKLAQRNHNPHKEHDSGIKHVLRYLAGTPDLKLVYRAVRKPVEGYVDADWTIDRKSYTGYAYFLGGSAIPWESKRQGNVALSSTEEEYIALTTAAK
ncbi:secreted RxLR effector protein 161-like [Rhagoletis pomonella]|uniref:secreted RxLR effector protein 161-like n=1 Tax=Rhagoletis pomonella TaxID=28610 RepID=UPI00177CE885|nr:secreted RxLR effector protein 161-like [Rhagoletis pomonella]